VAAFWLVSTSRAATEAPEYKVIRADGNIEIRDYPALTLAGTATDLPKVGRVTPCAPLRLNTDENG